MFNNTKEKIRDFKEREVLLDADLEQEQHPLLQFYVKIMPIVLDAERCSIFIHEPHSETTWLKVGTGLEERDI
ncbi:MAG: hypothetical protein HUJ31_15385, partial [Pseudomonadales bacterium]|nr:hypothetical protein [Pseudomonadales bacterium]